MIGEMRGVFMKTKIAEIFERQNGIMRTKELSENGVHYRLINKLIEEGKINKIRYGYYQWQDEKVFTEAAIVTRLFPDGILCMETALLYYDYTERTPAAWHIAVDNRSSRTRFKIDYPIVKPHYIEQDRLGIGVVKGEIDGVEVQIYNRERILCDYLRRINSTDGEIFNGVIKGYVKDSEKDIAQLMEYAKKLGVERKVRKMVGIWL